MAFPSSTFKLMLAPSFILCRKLFWYLPTTILEWEEVEGVLTSKGKFSPSYLPWYMNVFVVVMALGFGSCVYVVLNYKTATLGVVMYAIGLSGMSFLCWCLSAIIISFIDDVIAGMRKLLVFRHHLETLIASDQEATVPTPRGVNWRLIIHVQTLVIWVFSAFPVVFFPASFISNVSPFSFSMSRLIPVDKMCAYVSKSTSSTCLRWGSIVWHFWRILLSMICVAETCRFLAVFFTLFFSIIELTLGCLIQISRLSSTGVTNHLQFFKLYTTFQLIKVQLLPFISNYVAVLMGGGFAIFVLCNVATARLFGLVPLYVYFMFPVVTCVCIFFVYTLLPMGIAVNTVSSNLIRQRTRSATYDATCWSLSKWNFKLVSKKLKATRPMSWSCGTLYALEAGCESAYFLGVFLRSVDGLMLPVFRR